MPGGVGENEDDRQIEERSGRQEVADLLPLSVLLEATANTVVAKANQVWLWSPCTDYTVKHVEIQCT